MPLPQVVVFQAVFVICKIHSFIFQTGTKGLCQLGLSYHTLQAVCQVMPRCCGR